MTSRNDINKLLAVESQVEYGTTSEDSPVCDLIDTSFRKEFQYIGAASIPMVITFFLQFSLSVVSIFSVGHLGKTELAAVSLATMTFNICNGIFNGMSTSLDTFCSQAYGAGKYHLVGTQFQRGAAMVLTIAIPVNIIWWCSGTILKVFIPDQQLCDLAQSYLRVISFGSPGYILFETGKRFLQAQGIFDAAQYVLFIVVPMNVILNYSLVWSSKFGIGYLGAPIATAITYNLMATLLLLYVIFIDGKKCWSGLQIKESFRKWGPMAKLALPGVIMVEAEYFAFEVLTLAAARFGTESLAAQSVTSTISSMMFQFPFAVSVASSTRIAAHIGAQSIHSSKIAVEVTIYLSFCLSVILSVSLFCGKQTLISWFTGDDEVKAIASAAVTVLSFNQLTDTVSVVAQGCLRGQGRQNIGSNLNLFCYYVIAIPLSAYFAFKMNLGVVGLWLGLAAGLLVLSSAMLYYVFNVDWDNILQDAKSRNE